MASINLAELYKAPRLVARLQAFWLRVVSTAWPARTVVIADVRTIALPSEVSAVLDQAIQENSNHELDWLWHAKQMQNAEEQRYCLERARHINPGL